jgi:hypothetical protein
VDVCPPEFDTVSEKVSAISDVTPEGEEKVGFTEVGSDKTTAGPEV